jgi:glycerol-3-phosphate acyltransferase PlsY
MNVIWICLGAALLGYLMGSLPIGYLLVYLFKGIDLRQQGSGRTGGTNAMRAAGIWVGALTTLGDILKGAGAVWIVRALVSDLDVLPWAEMLGGALAVIGHNWSIFLGLKGGAGTGPNIGVAIALFPAFGLALIPVGAVLLFGIGYASVTSMTIAVLIPIGLAINAAVGTGSWVHPIYGVLTATSVFIALLPNFKRLKAGTERIVGPRAKARRRLEESNQSSKS